ncbi:hypothetical protein Droror1_Dr00022358 [Drosera rotundifolia]
MAAQGGGSKPTTSSPDSYIGSAISLTSKSEIRYEGILFTINAVESSIGLKNVRSFGTEGRKKDGPQVPPSDRVYEFILFRGSDIKDLQVKSSLSVPSTPSIENDPAIIKSHNPRPAAPTTSFPPSVNVSLKDMNTQPPQFGLPVSNFQGGLPVYQPGVNLGSWGPTPAPPNTDDGGSGLAVPMYWQGFYGTPNGLPQLHPQSLLRPPPGLPMPTSLQQSLPYPALNASLPPGMGNLPGSNLPGIPPLLSTTNSSTSLTSSLLPPWTLPQVAFATATSETSSSTLLSKTHNSSTLPMTSSTMLSSPSSLIISRPEASSISPPVAIKPSEVSVVTAQPKPAAQPSSIISSSAASSRVEPSAPSLLTPDQLLSSGAKTVSSSQPQQAAHKDVEVVQVLSSSEPSKPVASVAQPPILPLTPASKALHRPSGPSFQARGAGYRGRGRGRGSGSYRPVARFTEDFDFTAMNEKFNKDEVWGSLGKGNKTKEADGKLSDLDSYEEEDGEELPPIEVKPVYKKDDFFDTLSCNTLDQDSQSGRVRFSEQMKIDSETFGEFARFRGGGGGRGYARGGRGRGSTYGRGYGYAPRGRGRSVYARAS